MPRNSPAPKSSHARYAYRGLERVIHEKARLSILSSLASNPEGLLFTELRTLCALTDGNLSRQLQLLQETGFIEIWKGSRNNRPQTRVKLTPDGRNRFLQYIAVLEGLVSDALSTHEPLPKSAAPRLATT
jgi:DNA-binding MarR family transcriptional regulator